MFVSIDKKRVASGLVSPARGGLRIFCRVAPPKGWLDTNGARGQHLVVAAHGRCITLPKLELLEVLHWSRADSDDEEQREENDEEARVHLV